MRRLLLPALSMLVCAPADPVRADARFSPAAEQILEDVAYEASCRRVTDAKPEPVGEVFRRAVRRGAEVIVSEHARLQLIPFGMMDVLSKVTLIEDLRGRPVRFVYLDERKSVEGRPAPGAPGRMDVVRTEGDDRREKRMTLPAGLLTENGNLRKLVSAPRRIGERLRLDQFSVVTTLDGARTLEFEYLGTEDMTLDGRPVPTMKFRQNDLTPERDSRLMRWTSILWVDRRGVVFREEMTSLGRGETVQLIFQRVK
jgi:hypothetical protein